MKCEWAEGNLSAYLDNTLDPPLRAEVSEHLASCERCSAILADYRRYDALLADTVRVTPPESLRDRIFSSPEFSAILQSSARQADRQATRTAQPTQPSKPMLGPRWRPPMPMFPLTPATLDETPTEAPTAGANTPAASATDASPTDVPTRVPESTPTPIRPAHRFPLAKVLLPVAAALILALGVSAFFSQGFGLYGASRAQTPGQTTDVVGAPNFSTAPLAAGARLVFAHDGALWSVAEAGPTGAPGVAQRLTPPSVNVVAWSVSPITAGQGGAWIVYVDGNTGALHLVRSDRQADQIIGAVTAALAKGHSLSPTFWSSADGQAVLAHLSWSPNGQQIAYLEVATNGTSVNGIVASLLPTNAAGSPVAVRHLAGWIAADGAGAHYAWSADSAWLAFTQTPLGANATGGQSVWLYNATTGHANQLAAQADTQRPSATVTRLAIAQSGGQTVVTWAASDSGGITTGVFAQATTATTATRLTPDGASVTATDVSASGIWLVSNGGALATVSALAPAGTAPVTVATLSAPAQAINWSPTGTVAAIVSQGALALWSPTTGVTQVAGGVGSAPALAWSADGQRLAFTSGAQVTSAQLRDGRVLALTALGHTALASTLLWSPDGQLLASATATGALLTTSDGAHTTRVAAYAVDGDPLAWSIAG